MHMKRDRWRDIRASLEKEIMDGVLEPGTRLPTEPELAQIHQAGRHSVRRAIAELAKTGHLSIEQGRGTFVQPRPMLTYTIGPRTRMRRNMGAQGVKVTGETLMVTRIPATDRVAQRLGLTPGDEVIQTTRLTHADSVPVSFGTIYHHAARFPDLDLRREELGSLTAVYKSYGIADYLRGETEIHARQARPDEARMLRQHPEMPVIVVRAVDTDLEGTPLSYSQRIWSAARVKFNIKTSEDSE